MLNITQAVTLSIGSIRLETTIQSTDSGETGPACEVQKPAEPSLIWLPHFVAQVDDLQG